MLLVVEYRKEKPLPSQLASTQRGSVHRIVPSGVNSWRQLCPAKNAPLNDDDDGSLSVGQHLAHIRPKLVNRRDLDI